MIILFFCVIIFDNRSGNLKKVFKVGSLFFCVLLLVGCMDFRVNMDIQEDRSVDVAMSMEVNFLDMFQDMTSDESVWASLQQQFLTETCASSCPYEEGSSEYTSCMNTCVESSISTSTEVPSESELRAYLDTLFQSGELNEENVLSAEDREQLESLGYTVDVQIDQENYIYLVSISQQFDQIDDISSSDDVTVCLGSLFNGEEDNIFFVKKENDTYQANFVWDDQENFDENYADYDFSDYMTYVYEVTLPQPAISNNATEVSSDGKTLTWNVNQAQSNDIQYEFSFVNQVEEKAVSNTFSLSDDTLKIISIGLMAGGSIGLIIVFIVLAKKSKKDKM